MNKRSGTTLVALIVGMALSTFLITAVLQIFVTTKNNYKLSQNIAAMNEEMRFVVTRITNMVSYTGYVPSEDLGGGTAGLPSFYSTFNLATMSYFSPGWNSSATPGHQAYFSAFIKTDTSGLFTDCRGAPIPANSVYYPTFGSGGTGGNDLVCANQDSSQTSIFSDALVGMWVVYGYDRTNSTSSSISYYYNYLGVTTYNKRIRAVRIALLLKSRDEVLATPTTKSFSMFGSASAQTYGPITDRYIYRMHTFTIPLKQLPVPIPVS